MTARARLLAPRAKIVRTKKVALVLTLWKNEECGQNILLRTTTLCSSFPLLHILTAVVLSHDPLAEKGTVIRSGAVKMLEASRDYRCQNKTCGAVFSVQSDMSQGNLLAQPVRKPSIYSVCTCCSFLSA